MRTIIDLPLELIEWLAQVSERDGISRAEAIRRQLRTARELDRESSFESNLAAVFGMWKDRGIDALHYERELREEWER